MPQSIKILLISIIGVPVASSLIFSFADVVSAQVASLPAGTRTDYPVGKKPYGVAFDNLTNSVWVTNYGSDTVSKININTGTRIDYPVVRGPMGVAFDNVTNSVWVTSAYSGGVSKININTGARIDYPGGVWGIAFDNVTNSVWATNRNSNTVSKINIETGEKNDYFVGNTPNGVAFDNITNSVWVANEFSGTVSKVDINTGAKTDYSVDGSPYGVAFDDITNSVWVANAGSNTVSKVDITMGTKTDYAVGNGPYGVAFDNVTGSVWVTHAYSSTVSKININTGERIDYPTRGAPAGIAFDSITNSVWVTSPDGYTVSKIAIGSPWSSRKMINPTDGGILKHEFEPARNHYGIDIDKTLNQKPVKSPASGTIVKIDNISDSPAGKWIWVSHGSVIKKDESVAERISTRYLHMDTIAASMYVGKEVEQGEILGTVGTTGTSTAPHLHFEVRQGDIPDNLDYRLTTALDPLLFVNYAKSAFSVSVYSPVDIIITDPDGLILSKIQNDFGTEADYFELTESDGNNIMEYEIASVDQLKSGDYLISVVPEPGAQPDDVYTIKTSVCGGTVSLSENTPVKHIPETPYIIRTNGCAIERIIPTKIDTSIIESEYLLNSNLEIQFRAIDNIFGTANIFATLNGNTVSNNQVVTLRKPGSNVFTITATDNNGNITIVNKTFNVLYNTSGFLSPIKADGSGVYNQGRTLPVKCTLRDANGNTIPSVLAQLYVAKINESVLGNDEIPLSTSAADVGNQFRYDPNGQQYIFNLSTDTMSPGTWQLKAVLDSGQVVVTIVSIR